MAIQNKVQLITYPDSLGINLLELHYVLRRYLRKAVGGSICFRFIRHRRTAGMHL